MSKRNFIEMIIESETTSYNNGYKELTKKLIQIYFDDNKNKLVYLNTKKTNINAYQLYKKMGYEHIAFIKNKYFLHLKILFLTYLI